MSWKIFALPSLFIKEQYIVTSKAPGAEDMTALLEIFDNLTVVWEPAFPLANKEDCDELFTLRSCRHVALPFCKGPTICLLREGGGGVWVIWEKISCRLISNEKKREKCTWGNVPALKKNIYMLKKILKRLYVREKILTPEVWEKKFLSKPNHPTPLSHPLKSQLVGPKESQLSVLVPRRRSHQKPRADLDHGQKIPYHPLTCRSKMFVLRRASFSSRGRIEVLSVEMWRKKFFHSRYWVVCVT